MAANGAPIEHFASASAAGMALGIHHEYVRKVCNGTCGPMEAFYFRWKHEFDMEPALCTSSCIPIQNKKDRAKQKIRGIVRDFHGNLSSKSSSGRGEELSANGAATVYCDGEYCSCKRAQTKAIIAVDENGIVLAEFCSGVMAGLHLGVRSKTISDILYGRVNNPFGFNLQFGNLHNLVLQVTANGDIIKEFENVRAAGRGLQLNSGHIRDVCNGKRKIAKGLHFKWKYEDDSHASTGVVSTSSSSSASSSTSSSKHIPKLSKKRKFKARIFCDGDLCGCRRSSHAKPIIAVDGSGAVIAEYCSSVIAGRELSISKDSLGLILHGTRANPFDFALKFKNPEHYLLDGSGGKPVVRVSEGGDVIEEFESARAAGRALEIRFQSIGEVCNGKKVHANGCYFKWKSKFCAQPSKKRARPNAMETVGGMSEDEDEDELKDDNPCAVCGGTDEPAWALLCDRCDKSFHTFCVGLGRSEKSIPEHQWFCTECRGKEVQIRYDGRWYRGTILRIVPAGHRVQFDCDQSSALVPADEVATRIRPFVPRATQGKSRGVCGGAEEEEDENGTKFIDGDCPICLCPIESTERVKLEVCGHCLCQSCFDAITDFSARESSVSRPTRSGISLQCPLCRRETRSSLVS